MRKEKTTKDVWYYELNIERSLGKTDPLNDKDLEEFYALYADQGYSDNSWKVSVDDLDQNTFDLSPKNPNRVEEVDTRTPEEIIAEIEELDQQAAEALKAIKELL